MVLLENWLAVDVDCTWLFVEHGGGRGDFVVGKLFSGKSVLEVGSDKALRFTECPTSGVCCFGACLFKIDIGYGLSSLLIE